MANSLPPRRPAVRVNATSEDMSYTMSAGRHHGPRGGSREAPDDAAAPERPADFPRAGAPRAVPTLSPLQAAAREAAQSDEPAPMGFLASHFGNPESGEVYGKGNDYETEEQQVKQEKASASQAVWYLGALALFLALGYWLFGYR